MKLSKNCECVCKKFENLLTGCDLIYEKILPLDTKGYFNVTYKVKNGPCYSDFFLRSDLLSLVPFLKQYPKIDFFITLSGLELVFSVYVPNDL